MNSSIIEANSLRLRRLWTVIGYLMVAFVVYTSLTPTPITVPFEEGDKYAHVFAYGTLMFWFAQLYAGSKPRVLYACAFVALGVALEFVQQLTDYRTFEVADMIADASGVLVGWIVAPPRSPSLLQLIESNMLVRP